MANEKNQTTPETTPNSGGAAAAETIQGAGVKPKSYNPFISPVNEKAYTQMAVDADPNKLQNVIPQPQSVANRVNSNEDAYGMLGDMSMGGGGGGGNHGGGGAAGSGGAAFNPAMNGMPSAEKKMGAEQLAKLFLDGYEQLNIFANRALLISDKRLRKLEAEGEIDLSVQIPYEYGKTISAGEFVQTVNEQNKDTFSVTKEFKRDVMPPLVRILEKRGAGLTDEQYVYYMFGKDIAVKSFIAFQTRSTLNDIIEVMKQYTQAMREGGVVQPQAGGAQPPNNTGGGDTAQYYPAEEVPTTPIPQMPKQQDNFNFENNETYMSTIVQKHQLPEDGKAALLARRKLDREIDAAMKKHAPANAVTNTAGGNDGGKKFGKRGRKPRDYVPKMDDEQIAEALVLRETKETDTETIKGLD